MKPFHHLLRQFKRHGWLFALGVAALLATNWLQQYLPRLLKFAIDELQNAGGRPQLRDAALRGVLLWAALRLAVVAAQGGLRWGWRMGFFGMSRLVEYGLRKQMFEALLGLDSAFFRRMKMGDLLSRSMSDLAAVRESLGFGWLSFIDGVSTVAFTAWFMVHSDAPLTGLVLLPMLAVPVAVVTLGRRVRESSRKAQDLLDGLSQAATESFSGARVIHAYARQGAEAARFGAAAREYLERNMKLVRLEAVYWPLLTLLAGLSELLLFIFGGQRVAHGTMTAGGFAMFQDYLMQILWPVMALGVSSNMYVRGRVSMERLNDVLDAPASLVEAPGAAVAPPGPGAVLAMERVAFAYPGGAPVLDGISLALQAGEWVGLAGRTGCGKSSLLRLIPRLDDPLQGAVMVLGQDTRQWPLAALRSRVALVSQEPFLFSETVLENIAFGWQGEVEPMRARAQAAAEAAGLGPTVASLPQGLDSLLGEKGVNLSGGQKQRLALARALFMEPALLLLDDAFSAVDTATEEGIVATLRQRLPGTAVLMVSHRVSTLRLCSRVLVLEGGRISAEGSPQQLLGQPGLFYDMARREQLARRAGLEA
jgi:ATP-binding cassette subfamily B protein